MTLTDWKELEITQVILKELQARREYQKEMLAQSAGTDSLMDKWRTGVIAAFTDVLNIELADLEETQD